MGGGRHDALEGDAVPAGSALGVVDEGVRDLGVRLVACVFLVQVVGGQGSGSSGARESWFGISDLKFQFSGCGVRFSIFRLRLKDLGFGNCVPSRRMHLSAFDYRRSGFELQGGRV